MGVTKEEKMWKFTYDCHCVYNHKSISERVALGILVCPKHGKPLVIGQWCESVYGGKDTVQERGS